MTAQLALFGGPKAVTADPTDQWARPVEEQKRAVCELLDQGRLSFSGSGVPKAFEEEFRDYIGCKYVLTTSHGHLALASAFFAAGLGASDEFIHPTLGYIGGYAGALHTGARPVFCDVDPQTLLTDPDDVARRITDRTRVVNPIHRHGKVCDMDALLALCDRHGLVLVEDAAHAHGSEWDGHRIGSIGHIACFSFQGADPVGKPVTSGEGGAIATNDRRLYEGALVYCHLHRGGSAEEVTDPVLRKLDRQFLGWKWRAHPLALALARVSLASLDERIAGFAAARDELLEGLRGVPGLRYPPPYPKAKGAEVYGHIQLVYDPEAWDGLPASRVIEALRAEDAPVELEERGLEHLRALFTQDLPGLWGPGHPGPADQPLPRYARGDFPVAESLHGRVFHLRGWVEPAPGLVGQVAAAFAKVYEHRDALRQTAQPAGGASSER